VGVGEIAGTCGFGGKLSGINTFPMSNYFLFVLT